MNVAVPVGLLPVTVAVKVTLLPKVAGLAELVSVVVDAPNSGAVVLTVSLPETSPFTS